MSLLVHELLIGTGGGGGSKTTLQSSTNPVPLASVAVTRSSTTVQVAHLQQRVVTITSNHSRLTSAEGSKLADALAGIPPYSYSSTSSNHYVKSHHSPRRPVSHLLYSTQPFSSSDGVRPSKTFSTTKTYVLPFVLQDHNYGAPPPPTPHSPPPVAPPMTLTNHQTQNYKVHQILPSTNLTVSPKNNKTSYLSPSKHQTNGTKQYSKGSPDEPINATVNKVGFVQVSTSSNGEVIAPNSPVVSLMANMPLHRQQFMPHPKPSIYPQPHIPPPSLVPDSLMTQVNISNISGHDTDDESRVSERSSSLGPSGEETETSPEGEGEEQVQSDDSITRCICNFTHDDGYMIQCDRCFVWQHVDCMEIDRSNIPDEYLCEACEPRRTDKNKARSLQVRRRQEIRAHLTKISSSDSEDNSTSTKVKNTSKPQDRKILKRKKTKSSKENKTSRRQSLNSNKSPASIAINSHSKSTHNSDEKEIKSTKRKRQSSSCGQSQSSSTDESSNLMFTVEKVRSWIEEYEIAVTNHYSPELRAKIHAARINGISAEFRESTQAAMLGHRCRIAPRYDALPDSLEDKMLVAATRLKAETAIIEYQGKYTLKSQWGSVQMPPNMSYLPFVLQYDMTKEGLSICVDARTYGNDARFARRSSDYNAEIRHVVERGSVHLYIVACKDIEEEEEIRLTLDTAVCLRSSPAKGTNSAQSNNNKPDGNEKVKEESSKSNSQPHAAKSANIAKPTSQPQSSKMTPASQMRKNGMWQNKKNLRRPLLSLSLPQPLGRTSRRSTSNDATTSESKAPTTPTTSYLSSPVKERRSSVCGTGSRSPSKGVQKTPCKSPSKAASTEESSSGESPCQDSQSEERLDGHKMTREERKIAAYMKAFERMERMAQKKQGPERKRGDDRGKKHHHEDDEDDDEDYKVASKEVKSESERKGRGPKGSPRKHAVDFADGYKSGGESSEGERAKSFDNCQQGYGSPPYSGGANCGFRFPKTKKSLMNEWLNETIDPVFHSSPAGGEVAAGVPTCYMRSPATPMRKATSGSIGAGSLLTQEKDSRSAKKRWLRQAIIDETEPHSLGFFCSSPNSRPDSPSGSGIDYVTPLKKRRLARESMSSEQSNTPPSTPHHTSFEEKYMEETELDHIVDENADPKSEVEASNKTLPSVNRVRLLTECKTEEVKLDPEKSEIMDKLTIDLSLIKEEIKTEPLEKKADDHKEAKEKVLSRTKKEECCDEEETKENSKKNHGFKKLKKNVGTLLSTKSKKINMKRRSIVNIEKKTKCKTFLQEKLRKSKRKSSKESGKEETTPKKDKNANVEVKKELDGIEDKMNVKSCAEKDTNSLPAYSTDNFIPETKVEILCQEIKPEIKGQSKEISQHNLTVANLNQEDSSVIIDETTSVNKKNEEKEKDVAKPPLCELTQHLDSPAEISNKEPEIIQCNKKEQKTDIKTELKELVEEKTEKLKTECEEQEQNMEITKNGCVEVQGSNDNTPATTLGENSQDVSGKCAKDAGDQIISKPAPVKRKLSILEYRKRKSICSEHDSKDDTAPQKQTICPVQGKETDLRTEKFLESIPLPPENTKVSKTREISPPSEQVSTADSNSEKSFTPPKPLPLPEKGVILESANRVEEESKNVKWNAAPTLLEMQRENLTERLRKNFGLKVNGDSQSKLRLGLADKWRNFGKRYPSLNTSDKVSSNGSPDSVCGNNVTDSPNETNSSPKDNSREEKPASPPFGKKTTTSTETKNDDSNPADTVASVNAVDEVKCPSSKTVCEQIPATSRTNPNLTPLLPSSSDELDERLNSGQCDNKDKA